MEVKILSYDDLGNGIARVSNKVYFVKQALPNEVLEIEEVESKKNYSRASIKKIISPNSNRTEAICKYYSLCGGCNFLHAKYSEEKNFKTKKAINYFGKCDNFIETQELNYRNKVIFHVKNGNLGYYKENTNEIIPIDYCYLLSPRINEVLKLLLKKKDKEFNGEVLIRENSQEEIVLAIKGNYNYIDYLKQSYIINNLIYNDKVIKGNNYFIEEIDNYKFKVNYNSFFQVNRKGLKEIKKILDTFLETKKINNVLDLYSGTSVLGIFLSSAKKVISIEENKYATSDAKINLELNNINNLEVITGKVEDKLKKFQNIDLVVVDPARRGLDNKTIDKIIALNSKYLIYISCEMISLRRDLKKLESVYEILNIYLVDMFPRTNKVETVCIFKLQDKVIS